MKISNHSSYTVKTLDDTNFTVTSKNGDKTDRIGIFDVFAVLFIWALLSLYFFVMSL